ncbi:MAG: PAS domain S-box protein [Cyclobacteriaceae bacterium]
MKSRIDKLEEELTREKQARKDAEKKLEKKTHELYKLRGELKIANRSRPTKTKAQAGKIPRTKDAYMKIDLEGNILAVNRLAMTLLGHDPRKRHINVFDLIYKDDFGPSIKAFEELIETGSVYDIIVRLYSNDGSIKTVSVNGKALYDEKGKATTAEGFIRDITDQSKIHERLAKSEELLSIIVSNSPFGILFTEDDIIKEVNPAFEKIIGYSHKELINMDAKQLNQAENYEETRQIREDLDEGKRFVEFKLTITRKDGSLAYTKINVINVPSGNDGPDYRLTIVQDITEESRRKEAFEEQSKQLQLIVENSPVGIALSDSKGLMKVNRRYQDLLGYSEDELRTMNFKDYTYTEDVEYNSGLLQKMYRGELDQFSIKKRYIKKDGSHLQAKTTVGAIRGADGKVKNEVVIIEDITEEARRKEEFEEQSKQLELIVENSPLGIALSNSQGLMKVNRKFCELLGYSEEELKAMTFRDYTYEEDIETSSVNIQKLYAGEVNQFSLVKRYIKADGSVLHSKTTVSAIRKPDGEIKYEVVLIEDITEELKQKEVFEENKKELEVIVNNSLLGIGLSGSECFTKVNLALCDLLGYSENELKQLTMSDYTHKDDLPESLALREKLFVGELDNFVLNKRYIRKNGSVINVRSNVSAVKGADGKTNHLVVVIEDISEQVKSEEIKEELLNTLEKRNIELQEYAHIVSHDLKSPLRNIATLVSWIKTDCTDINEHIAFQHVLNIEQSVQKMENLINGILAYANVEHGDRQHVPVNLDKLINDTIAILNIPEHVDVKVVRPLPWMNGDPTRFQQLFQNLIGNAIKFIDKERGLVEIDCAPDNEYYIFSVKDNGAGIAKEYHDKIFQIFEYLDDSETNQSTGIGLSIVKKIVETYEGSITLESEEGVGTTFYVKLKKEA